MYASNKNQQVTDYVLALRCVFPITIPSILAISMTNCNHEASVVCAELYFLQDLHIPACL